MSNTIKVWNLSSPKMCRDFLENLRIGPPDQPEKSSSVTHFELEGGGKVSLSEATDEQIVSFANQIAQLIHETKKEKK